MSVLLIWEDVNNDVSTLLVASTVHVTLATPSIVME